MSLPKDTLTCKIARISLAFENVTPNEWMTIGLDLQPTIYKLNKGDKLRLVLYTTDFEHTIRDNSDYELTVDPKPSQMTFLLINLISLKNPHRKILPWDFLIVWK